MEGRVYNFSAGPSMLADEVMLQLRDELLNYEGSGMSVMEMSHRSALYLKIVEDTKESLRRLMNIPDSYEILFMHGGATAQFSMVPMNLFKKGKADYIITGNFSKKAAEEAMKYGEVHIAYDSSGNNHTHIPSDAELDLSEDADYVHICSNNTIFGTEWKKYPDTHGIPLVADMSSDILSHQLNVEDFGVIYAGAQKNMGIAGLAVVIIRKDLLDENRKDLPPVFSYALEAKNNSMYNTPATYSIYVLGKVLQWLEDIGGIEEIERRNKEKARLLYDYLDSQTFYKPHSEKECRSLMNVTFRTTSEELDSAFVKKAAENGLLNLKGHRLTKGIRVSMYNAMPVEAIRKLIDVMAEFAEENRQYDQNKTGKQN